MSRIDTLVIGASVAGVRCARALRTAGHTGTIVLADAEPGAPYDKPPLTKSFLNPEAAVPTLVEPAALEQAGIDFRPGRAATALDVPGHRVTFDDGPVDFDNLVLAVGSVPRMLPVLDRPDLPVGAIRTAESARTLRGAMQPGAVIAVVGGGFLGLEVAATAARLGVTAHVVEFADHLLGRGLAPAAAAVITDLHRRHGTQLHLGCAVSSASPAGSRVALELSDGTALVADFVVVAVGADPAIGWLRGSGLELSDGVDCDSALRAAPDVWAVGDCARWLNPRYGIRMRLEHWTGAGEQALHVARQIATGQPGDCAIVPFVWSDQFDRRLQIAGVRGDTTHELTAADGSPVFVECTDDHVVGVAALDQPRAVLGVRRALAGDAPARLADLFPTADFATVG